MTARTRLRKIDWRQVFEGVGERVEFYGGEPPDIISGNTPIRRSEDDEDYAICAYRASGQLTATFFVSCFRDYLNVSHSLTFTEPTGDKFESTMTSIGTRPTIEVHAEINMSKEDDKCRPVYDNGSYPVIELSVTYK